MTTDPLALVAAMPMPEPSLMSRDTYTGEEVWAFDSDDMRAARLEAAQLVLAQGEPAAMSRNALIDIIRQGLSCTYHCSRVWMAWSVGTMSEDDFSPVDESDTPEDFADAILARFPAAAPVSQAVDSNAGPPYSLDTMDPVLRDLIVSAVHGAIATNDVPPAGHWLTSSWQMGQGIRAEMGRQAAPAAPVNAEMLAAPSKQADAKIETLPLLQWAVERWYSEVSNRPLVNRNRRALDDTWRQVIRFAGGDPDALLGPSHDALVAIASAEAAAKGAA